MMIQWLLEHVEWVLSAIIIPALAFLIYAGKMMGRVSQNTEGVKKNEAALIRHEDSITEIKEAQAHRDGQVEVIIDQNKEILDILKTKI